MSMAMLLNAATVAEARHKLLDPNRGRIPIHSLLCTPDGGNSPSIDVSHRSTTTNTNTPRRTVSVLGKRKASPIVPVLMSHVSINTASETCRQSRVSAECWSSEGYTDSDSSRSPMRRRRRRRRSFEDVVSVDGVVAGGGGGGGSDSASSPGSGDGGGSAQRNNAPRRRWKEDEDALLIMVVREHGPGRWNRLAEQFPGRNGRQVRLRWMNHLQPSLDKREWRKEEDDILLEAHATLGNKWALIAMKLNGRTDNSVKNRYKSLMRRQQREIRTKTPSR